MLEEDGTEREHCMRGMINEHLGFVLCCMCVAHYKDSEAEKAALEFNASCSLLRTAAFTGRDHPIGRQGCPLLAR